MNLLHHNNRNLILYFQIHQPARMKNFSFFDIGTGAPYFDNELNARLIKRVSKECYLPTNDLLLKLIQKHPDIKITFSISGSTIDQLEEHAPEVLESFRNLATTGSVEFLSETYYHSLSCMTDTDEFETQIVAHAEKIYEHFGVHPSVFRNTELVYNNEIGKRVNRLGFQGIVTDGIERILGEVGSNHVFQHPEYKEMKVLLRNYRLSDDIAFRFNHKEVTAKKYLSWIDALPKDETLVNLAMDYETFGEHRKADSGIFKFLEDLLSRLANSHHLKMLTPSQAIDAIEPHGTLNVPHHISWADEERDLSAWLGNDMQRDAFDTLMHMEHDIKLIDDALLLKQWRNLQNSDHLYYMSTKKNNGGIIQSNLSPYPSPYEAFINFMNVVSDLALIVKSKSEAVQEERRTIYSAEAERRKLTTPLWALSLESHGYDHHN